MKSITIILLSVLQIAIASASPARYERSINSRWTFHKEGSDITETVNIPHTWNALDCQDDTPGYWRGTAWYEKTVIINDELDGKRLFVRFEGANQELDLYVNDLHAGNHKGGYTAFVFDISQLVKRGCNSFKIKLTNSHDEAIPPMRADFTFFGGVYRDVSLIFVPENHISVSHYASSGVYISTPECDRESAKVKIVTHLTLNNTAKRLILEQQIIDPKGNAIATLKHPLRSAPATSDYVVEQHTKIINPVLWDLDSPEQYSLITRLLDKNGKVIDKQLDAFGIRYFNFDPDKGFFLNGRHVKLIGTNRHQDYKNLGNAVPDEIHLRDVRQLKKMGGNFLRIAHYPQDPIISGTCDEMGIVTCVEIPIIDRIGNSPDFTENCINMALEMVYQNYNHPSMIIWAYMNEVLIESPWNTGKISQKDYFALLYDCASRIDEAIKKADPLRPTMIPNHNFPERYKQSGITDIPDILGFNLYCGWYTGGLDSLGPTLDKLRDMFPGKSLILTEYGADADSRLHSFSPECFDYTCEYGLMFHKHYIQLILEKEYLAGSNVWNLNDFYSEFRGFAVPHVNCKGLATLDRIPKDSYWFYTAMLSGKPFIRIGGADWKIRGGQASKGVCLQPVEVFSTAAQIELKLNGKSLGTKSKEGHSAVFDIPFTDGENILEAYGSDGVTDILRVDFRMIPEDLSKFKEINVMLGSKRYFEDRNAGQIWIPEQEYHTGSWGYVGGQVMRPRYSSGARPAFEANILGTSIDPVFQTQRAGLEAFKADVPNGKYYVYLYFAELAGPVKGKPMPYNLGNDILTGDITPERVFDVAINGKTVLEEFDLSKTYGNNVAVIKKFPIDVCDGSGVTVSFKAIKGLPVLNAVRIFKVQ